VHRRELQLSDELRRRARQQCRGSALGCASRPGCGRVARAKPPAEIVQDLAPLRSDALDREEMRAKERVTELDRRMAQITEDRDRDAEQRPRLLGRLLAVVDRPRLVTQEARSRR